MKKNHKSTWKAALLLCTALGWWGLLYPELLYNSGIIRTTEITSDGSFIEIKNEQELSRLYGRLLSDGKNVRLKSKLLEDINAFLEAYIWDNTTRN